jgi:hypothetical protein
MDLFVSYQYRLKDSWGFGHLVFPGTRMPRVTDDVVKIADRLRETQDGHACVIINMIELVGA